MFNKKLFFKSFLFYLILVFILGYLAIHIIFDDPFNFHTEYTLLSWKILNFFSFLVYLYLL